MQKHQTKGVPIHLPSDFPRAPKPTQENWFQPGGNNKFSSVIFVPSTPGSSLMKSLQVLEEQNNQGRKNRIKFVEKAGRTVRNVVARNYP